MINLLKSKMNKYNYKDWISYFKSNDQQRLHIDFSKELPLTDSERRLITPSVWAFQKGEGSDGRHLMNTVEAYINMVLLNTGKLCYGSSKKKTGTPHI